MILKIIHSIVLSIALITTGAFLQFRYDILGLGLHVSFGQYNIVPGLPIVPHNIPKEKQESYKGGEYRFDGKVFEPTRKVMSITIDGKKYDCFGRYGSSEIMCLPVEKSA